MLTMSVTPISAIFVSPMRGNFHSHSHNNKSPFTATTTTTALSSYSSSLNHSFSSQRKSDKKFTVFASNEIVNAPKSGVVFEPFQELKNDAFVVPVAPHVSIARHRYSDKCETAINDQIKCVCSSFLSFLYVSLFFIWFFILSMMIASLGNIFSL